MLKKMLFALILAWPIFGRALNVPQTITATAVPNENVSSAQVLWLNQSNGTINQALSDNLGNLKVNVAAGSVSITTSGTPLPVEALQVIGETLDENGDLDQIHTEAVNATLVSPTGSAIAVTHIPGYKIRVLGYSWSFSTITPTASTAAGLLSGTTKGILSVIPFGLAAAGEQSSAPHYLFQTNLDDDLLYAQYAGTSTQIMYLSVQWIYVRDPLATATPTITATTSPTPTITLTATFSPTTSPTPSITLTRTITNTLTDTKTITLTPTQTITPSVTKTLTDTRTVSPSLTATITETDTKTITLTKTDTFTRTVSPTPTLTITVTFSKTPSPTRTWSVSPTWTTTKTPTPSATPTPTPTATPTPTPTNTP